MSRVGVVILNWNGAKDTIDCINKSSWESQHDIYTLVIDNASENEDVQKLSDFATKNRFELITANPEQPSIPDLAEKAKFLLLNQANTGFSGGCNMGFKIFFDMGMDYVFLLNNDAILLEGAIDHCIETSQSHSTPIVGATILDQSQQYVLFSGAKWPDCLFSKKSAEHPNQDIPSAYGEGSGVLVRRDLIELALRKRGEVLDHRFFMYAEDCDLGLFAKEHGYTPWIASKAKVIHKLSNSAGGPGNPSAYYYCTRNRIFLVKKWCSSPLYLLFLLYYLPTRAGLLGIHFMRGRFRVAKAVIAGVKDGIQNNSEKWSLTPLIKSIKPIGTNIRNQEGPKVEDSLPVAKERKSKMPPLTVGHRYFCPPRFKFVRKHFRRNTEIKILDVGCGNHSPTITKYWIPNSIYHGADIQDFNIDNWDRQAIDKYFKLMPQVEAYDIIPNEEYDFVILNHVLEHIWEQEEIIAQLCKKLRPGGIIWIAFPSLRSLSLPQGHGTLHFCDDPTHVRCCDVREVANWLLKNNVKVLKGGRSHNFVRMLAGLIRLPFCILSVPLTGMVPGGWPLKQ